MAESNEKGRQEGRAMACDGLLASEFGCRKTEAGANAIRQLRFLEKRRRTARDAWLAMAASIAILLGGAFYFLGNETGAWLAVLDTSIPGGAVLRDNRIIEPISGLKLMPGDVIQTPKGIVSKVRFHGSQSLLTIAEQSELKFLVTASEPSLELHRGAIDMEFVPQAPGSFLTVSTEQAEARVTGTHFLLAAKQTSTWLQVMEGRVQFARLDGGATIVVASHQYSVAAQGLELTVHPEDERWQAPYSVKSSALAFAL